MDSGFEGVVFGAMKMFAVHFVNIAKNTLNSSPVV